MARGQIPIENENFVFLNSITFAPFVPQRLFLKKTEDCEKYMVTETIWNQCKSDCPLGCSECNTDKNNRIYCISCEIGNFLHPKERLCSKCPLDCVECFENPKSWVTEFEMKCYSTLLRKYSYTTYNLTNIKEVIFCPEGCKRCSWANSTWKSNSVLDELTSQISIEDLNNYNIKLYCSECNFNYSLSYNGLCVKCVDDCWFCLMLNKHDLTETISLENSVRKCSGDDKACLAYFGEENFENACLFSLGGNVTFNTVSRRNTGCPENCVNCALIRGGNGTFFSNCNICKEGYASFNHGTACYKCDDNCSSCYYQLENGTLVFGYDTASGINPDKNIYHVYFDWKSFLDTSDDLSFDYFYSQQLNISTGSINLLNFDLSTLKFKTLCYFCSPGYYIDYKTGYSCKKCPTYCDKCKVYNNTATNIFSDVYLVANSPSANYTNSLVLQCTSCQTGTKLDFDYLCKPSNCSFMHCLSCYKYQILLFQFNGSNTWEKIESTNDICSKCIEGYYISGTFSGNKLIKSECLPCQADRIGSPSRCRPIIFKNLQTLLLTIIPESISKLGSLAKWLVSPLNNRSSMLVNPVYDYYQCLGCLGFCQNTIGNMDSAFTSTILNTKPFFFWMPIPIYSTFSVAKCWNCSYASNNSDEFIKFTSVYPEKYLHEEIYANKPTYNSMGNCYECHPFSRKCFLNTNSQEINYWNSIIYSGACKKYAYWDDKIKDCILCPKQWSQCQRMLNLTFFVNCDKDYEKGYTSDNSTGYSREKPFPSLKHLRAELAIRIQEFFRATLYLLSLNKVFIEVFVKEGSKCIFEDKNFSAFANDWWSNYTYKPLLSVIVRTYYEGEIPVNETKDINRAQLLIAEPVAFVQFKYFEYLDFSNIDIIATLDSKLDLAFDSNCYLILRNVTFLNIALSILSVNTTKIIKFQNMDFIRENTALQSDISANLFCLYPHSNSIVFIENIRINLRSKDLTWFKNLFFFYYQNAVESLRINSITLNNTFFNRLLNINSSFKLGELVLESISILNTDWLMEEFIPSSVSIGVLICFDVYLANSSVKQKEANSLKWATAFISFSNSLASKFELRNLNINSTYFENFQLVSVKIYGSEITLNGIMLENVLFRTSYPYVLYFSCSRKSSWVQISNVFFRNDSYTPINLDKATFTLLCFDNIFDSKIMTLDVLARQTNLIGVFLKSVESVYMEGIIVEYDNDVLNENIIVSIDCKNFTLNKFVVLNHVIVKSLIYIDYQDSINTPSITSGSLKLKNISLPRNSNSDPIQLFYLTTLNPNCFFSLFDSEIKYIDYEDRSNSGDPKNGLILNLGSSIGEISISRNLFYNCRNPFIIYSEKLIVKNNNFSFTNIDPLRKPTIFGDFVDVDIRSNNFLNVQQGKNAILSFLLTANYVIFNFEKNKYFNIIVYDSPIVEISIAKKIQLFKINITDNIYQENTLGSPSLESISFLMIHPSERNLKIFNFVCLIKNETFIKNRLLANETSFYMANSITTLDFDWENLLLTDILALPNNLIKLQFTKGVSKLKFHSLENIPIADSHIYSFLAELPEAFEIELIDSNFSKLKPSSLLKFVMDFSGIKNVLLLRTYFSECTFEAEISLSAILNFEQVDHLQLLNVGFSKISCSKCQEIVSISDVNNITLSNSNFNRLKAGGSGALAMRNALYAFLYENTFSANQANDYGGALVIKSIKYLMIEYNRFLVNAAGLEGGAIFVQKQEKFDPRACLFSIKFCEFYNNNSTLPGFSISNVYQPMIFSNNTLFSIDDPFLNYSLKNNPARLVLETEDIASGSKQVFKSDELLISKHTPGSPYHKIISLYYIDEFGNKINERNFGKGLSLNFTVREVNRTIDDKSIFEIVYNEVDVVNDLDFEYNTKSAFTFKQPFVLNGPRNSTGTIFLAVKPSLPEFSNYSSVDTTLSNIGMLNSFNISVEFSDCEVGQYFDTFESRCINCSKGSYSFMKNAPCIECPSHITCHGRDNTSIDPTYWRESNSSIDLIYCKGNEKACPGGSGLECSVGHIGPLCNECDFLSKMKYVKTPDNTCEPCFSSIFTYFQMAFVGLATIGSIILSIKSSNNFTSKHFHFSKVKKMFKLITWNTKNLSSAALMKLFLHHFQLLSAIGSFDVDLPDLKRVFQYSTFFGNPLNQGFYSSRCYLENVVSSKEFPFIYTRLIFNLLIPLGLFVVSSVFLLIFSRFLDVKQTGIITTTLLFVFTYFQPDFITYGISLISCKKIGLKSYIFADYMEECNNSTYTYYTFILSLPMVLVFGLLIPLFMIVFLIKNKPNLNAYEFRLKFGFLYNEYKLDSSYWDLIKLVERIIFIILVNYFTDWPITKGFFLLIFSSVYCLLSYKLRPYEIKIMNQLDLFSAMSIQICLMATIVTFTSKYQFIIIIGYILIMASNIIFSFYLISNYIIIKLEELDAYADSLKKKKKLSYIQKKSVTVIESIVSLRHRSTSPRNYSKRGASIADLKIKQSVYLSPRNFPNSTLKRNWRRLRTAIKRYIAANRIIKRTGNFNNFWKIEYKLKNLKKKTKEGI